MPYYRFQEVLTVREADRDRFRTLADLRGRRVATLGGTIAYEMLLAAEREHGIIAVSYDDDVHPYTDTLNGRVDAVLLDNVLADRAMRRNAGCYTQPDRGRPTDTTSSSPPPTTPALRDEVDRDPARRHGDGRLEAIFRKWNVWTEAQPQLYASVLSGSLDPGRPTSAEQRIALANATRRCATSRRCCAPPASRSRCRAWRC